MSVVLDSSAKESLLLRTAYLLSDDKILYVSLRPQSKIDAEIYTNNGFTEHFEWATITWDLFDGGVTGIEVMSPCLASLESLEDNYQLSSASGKAIGVLRRDSETPFANFSITLIEGKHLVMRFSNAPHSEILSLGNGGYVIIGESNQVHAIVLMNLEQRDAKGGSDAILRWG